MHVGDGRGLGEKVKRGLPRSFLFYKRDATSTTFLQQITGG